MCPLCNFATKGRPGATVREGFTRQGSLALGRQLVRRMDCGNGECFGKPRPTVAGCGCFHAAFQQFLAPALWLFAPRLGSSALLWHACQFVASWLRVPLFFCRWLFLCEALII
jgi:hypothetical protein